MAAVWPTASLSSSSIIITTQKPCDSLKWTDFDIPLHPLSETAGSTLLLTQIPTGFSDESKAEQIELAMEISSTVGGLPLWLNALAGFIAQSQCSLSECLDSYKSLFHPLDQGMKAGSWTYEKTPSTVFDLAFSKLCEDAKTLLYLLAFLNPDGVPESMLSIDSPDDSLAFLESSSRSRSVYPSSESLSTAEFGILGSSPPLQISETVSLSREKARQARISSPLIVQSRLQYSIS